MKNITTKQAQAMTKKDINNLIQKYNKLNKQQQGLNGRIICANITKENEKYLSSQLITYLGNKRKLIDYIESEIVEIHNEMGVNKTVNVDIFSGSGVVARMMKKYSSSVIANDLEEYSYIINKCFLSNEDTIDFEVLQKHYDNIYKKVLNEPVKGVITNNYAPKNEKKIRKEERVFYTVNNAIFLDTAREYIETIDNKYKEVILSILLYKASVHTNTSGIFKGFHKKDGIGCYGGSGEVALSRIKGEIGLELPQLSNYNCNSKVYCEDANVLARKLKDIDIVYIDPPYNQHPYGSNYFMLNVLTKNKLDVSKISKISGIPNYWNRSRYNKRKEAEEALYELIRDIDAKYVIISYNSEGFISKKKMESILGEFGTFTMKEITYNTYKGSYNLNARDLYVEEYI